ncbi:MAG: hypothetical protein V3T47_06070 [Gammaproteobacteria bacterium]
MSWKRIILFGLGAFLVSEGVTWAVGIPRVLGLQTLPQCFVRTPEVIPHRGEVAAHGGNNLVEQQSLGHPYNIMKNVIIANLAGAEPVGIFQMRPQVAFQRISRRGPRLAWVLRRRPRT